MKTLSDTWFMVVRQARNLMREPIWIALLLIQPMVWLMDGTTVLESDLVGGNPGADWHLDWV